MGALTLPDQPHTTPFDLTFGPAHEAVQLLADVANGAYPDTHARRARAVVEAWHKSRATATQTAAVETNDELEVDDEGACVSLGDDGFFIQTWTWISYGNHPELDPERDGKDAGNSVPSIPPTAIQAT